MINYINNLRKELGIVKNKINTEENKYKAFNYEKMKEILITGNIDKNFEIQKEVV